ncbi:MAG: hypothetical protein CVV33_04440 [Methanomicrobiales archaeon HGW-Methanomicrobiales-4]|nr:MAG: hypothetical protein CVV33_04440 [Methanomicrobiales archaeon HGW-Methanomicrobiales-4]
MTEIRPEKNHNLTALIGCLSDEQRTGILLAVCILLLTAFLFWQLAYTTVIALSLAVVMMPVQRLFAEKIGRGYAAISVCLLALAAIAVFFCILITSVIITRLYIFEIATTIADSIRNFQPGSGTMIANVLSSLHGLMNESGSANLIENSTTVLLNSMSSLAQSIPGLAVQVFILILILFLLLRNGEQMASGFSTALPTRMTRYLTILWKVVSDTMYGVYVVNMSVAILTFFITIPFFWYLGYGQILFWAFLCAASHLFPFFGPQLITLILAIYALALGDMRGLILIAFIGYPLISGVQDFWIRPRMLAKRVAMHPALMMIGIFGGMLVMGPVGLIIGPLIVALADASYVILIDIGRERRKEEYEECGNG